MKGSIQSICVLFLLFIVLPAPIFADDTGYADIKFPQWAHDVRRTSIITFGSLPFVTIWATLAYSELAYGEFHNPFDKSADGFTTEDQKAIMQLAAVTCVGLGLTDLAVTLVRRVLRKRRLERQSSRAITITPLREGDGAAGERTREPPPQTHLCGGIESAVF